MKLPVVDIPVGELKPAFIPCPSSAPKVGRPVVGVPPAAVETINVDNVMFRI